MLSYSSKGLELTKEFEGCRLSAYQDQRGKWTIGYGHTGLDVRRGMVITLEQAESLLLKDMATAVSCVNRNVATQISQSQFDALVDFTFNLGCQTLMVSTLIRKVNARDFSGAAEQFLRWDHVAGAVIPGLTRRRQAEKTLFESEAA